MAPFYFHSQFDFIYSEAFRIIGERFPILWHPLHEDRAQIIQKKEAYEEVRAAVDQIHQIPIYITGINQQSSFYST